MIHGSDRPVRYYQNIITKSLQLLFSGRSSTKLLHTNQNDNKIEAKQVSELYYCLGNGVIIIWHTLTLIVLIEIVSYF